MQYHVVPSLPAQSFTEITDLADALGSEVTQLQIDIVDGQFVESVSWPFTEAEPMQAITQLSSLTDHFALEVDCMMLNPERLLSTLAGIGVSRVIVHIGSTDDYGACIAHARLHDYKIGIAFTNDVAYETYQPLIPQVDFVQVMGIAVVGKQGQPFDERTLDTVRELRDRYPELEIAVDGSVNLETIADLKAAGVNRFAPGSAIAKQADPLAAYHQLVQKIS